MELFAEVKLTPGDISSGGQFGFSVSIDGNRALVSKPYDRESEPGSGAVYYFEFDDHRWNELDKIIPVEDSPAFFLGHDVAIDGDVAIISSVFSCGKKGYGCAYIYRLTDNKWVFEQKLEPSNGIIWDVFGGSVDLEGDVAIVSARSSTTNDTLRTGSVYIFRYSDSTWTETQQLVHSDAKFEDEFGYKVSLSGDRLAVSTAPENNLGPFTGSVYIFESDGMNFTEIQKITDPTNMPETGFGRSLSLNDDRILIGALTDDTVSRDKGAAYDYQFNGSEWVENQRIYPAEKENTRYFGIDLKLSDNHLIINNQDLVSSKENDNGTFSHYQLDESNQWNLFRTISITEGATGGISDKIDLSGDRVIAGAQFDTTEGLIRSGSAYIFELEIIFNSSFD